MSEEKISKAYAYSIIQLGEENNIDIADELTKFNVAINESNDLENLLFLDLFTIEEKQSVVNEVIAKLELSLMIKNFINFLLVEKRINIFPSIFKEVVIIDDHKKGFLRGVIEGRTDEISEEIKKKLTDYLKGKVGKEPLLHYKKNEKITAGYRVTLGDLQLDASLESQLEKLRKNILSL